MLYIFNRNFKAGKLTLPSLDHFNTFNALYAVSSEITTPSSCPNGSQPRTRLPRVYTPSIGMATISPSLLIKVFFHRKNRVVLLLDPIRITANTGYRDSAVEVVGGTRRVTSWVKAFITSRSLDGVWSIRG